MKMKTVYVGGTFDRFHDGHKEIFYDLKAMFGEELKVVVAVNSDAFVKSYAPEKKVQDEDKRMFTVEEYVYDFFPYKKVDVYLMPSFETQKTLLEVINPDFVYHGTDWTGESTPSIYEQFGVTKDWCEMNEIVFIYTDRRAEVSSTALREKEDA